VAQARYPYLGPDARLYTQYLDVTDAPRPLEAELGRSYAMTPVPGWDDGKGGSLLPVPPGDGRWGDALAAGHLPDVGQAEAPPVPDRAAEATPASKRKEA